MPSDERIVHVERRIVAGGIVAHGTLACPECDAPVALAGERVTPRDVLACPFCDHHGLARDFLSLSTPGRPARVVVRILV
jgi:hypothetical protein